MSATPISLRPDSPAVKPRPASITATGGQPRPELRGDSIAARPNIHAAAAADQAPAPTTPGADRKRAALIAALLERVPVADRPAAKTAIPAILDAARQSGSADANRIAYLLATAQTESDFGAHMTEIGHSKGWFDRVYGGADGNRPGTDDGYRYRGRGYVQTTRAGRYAELSHHLGLPDVKATAGNERLQPELVAHPERLAQPQLAAKALVVGVVHNLFTHNRAAALDRTIPAGKEPGAVDFYHARGIVNGIVKSQATAVARHATVYATILAGFRNSVLGAPEPK